MGIKDVSMEFKNGRADEGVGSNSGRTVYIITVVFAEFAFRLIGHVHFKEFTDTYNRSNT